MWSAVALGVMAGMAMGWFLVQMLILR